MPSQRVLVSFSSSQAFLSSGNWNQIFAALQSQLPLRNIHWKPTSKASIRTIQELYVNILPLDKLRDDHTSQIPVTLLEKPLLNIYIVNCEDNDLEAYRSLLKRQIKEWHSLISARKNQEWLILQVVRNDARVQSGNFFQLKGAVIDKIRADFNSDKKERCVQLTWSPGNDNPAAWGEFINKLKDGILSAFDSAITSREEEVRRSESQRQLPGWNFCTFFILKECLANSFADVTLFEDALMQYDELEASFYQVLKEKKNLSWFGTLISPGPTDDSAALLSITKKPYRDLIIANNISVFDFRNYLLARQCHLLASLGRLNEVYRKVGAFLGAFGRRLREMEDQLPKFFVESWIYSSALSVVDQSDDWASSLNLEGSVLSSFNAGKAELTELARNQLDIIGIEVGHIPREPPFSMVYPSSPTSSQTKSKGKISHADLLKAIDSKDAFFDLCIGITNRAIEMYANASRRKFALKLHGSLAALDVHRGRLDVALTTYTSLPAHYSPHMWTSLESLMLSRALDIRATLRKPDDREWIHILLSFLKTFVDGRGTELLAHEEDKVTYMEQLVTAMQAAASKLDADLPYADHSAFGVDVSSSAQVAETRDGSYLDITIHNDLPCPIPIDEVSVTLVGRDSEQLRYTAAATQLSVGRTSMKLFCPTSSSGTYLLDSSEIRMSRLLLQWSHCKDIGNDSMISMKTRILVRVPKDYLALDVGLHQPNHIELGKPAAVLLRLFTGRNHVLKAKIKLTSSVPFYCDKAILISEGELSLETSEDSLALVDLARDSIVSVLVPHPDTSTLHAMRVLVEVEYVTQAEPEVDRHLRGTRSVSTLLPIAVNVEDFFRGKRLFSRFTVSTTSHQHVRILDAQLEPPSDAGAGLEIASCASPKRAILTVTPNQPANFLFHIDSIHGPIREPLTLKIKYRMLQEEVESVIEAAVNAALSDQPSLRDLRIPITNELIEKLKMDSRWLETYRLSGELVIPEELDQEEAYIHVKKLLGDQTHRLLAKSSWREIKIPVDVPNMNIVAAVGIKIVPHSDPPSSELPPLYAGQPIDALLTIHTSFHWGSDRDRQYLMQFDVEEMVRDWLVSGKKRGDFLAKHDETFSVPITLIALHHGELALPKVVVLASPLAGEVTMGSLAIPTTETHQVHGAEKVMVLPRGGRSTFLVTMG